MHAVTAVDVESRADGHDQLRGYVGDVVLEEAYETATGILQSPTRIDADVGGLNSHRAVCGRGRIANRATSRRNLRTGSAREERDLLINKSSSCYGSVRKGNPVRVVCPGASVQEQTRRWPVRLIVVVARVGCDCPHGRTVS